MRLCSSQEDILLQALRMLRLFALCTKTKLILCLMETDNALEFPVVTLLGLAVICELQSRKKGKLQTIPLS